MQYIQRYNLKSKSAPAYQAWLQKNEPAMRENAPEGWTYVGTWFTVQGLGRFDCETRWEIEDYSALGGSFGNETFQRLLREAFEFGDEYSRGENCLMKSAQDVRIMATE